jgi:hypothetical protein
MTTAEMTGVVRKMSVTRMIDVERAMAQAKTNKNSRKEGLRRTIHKKKHKTIC